MAMLRGTDDYLNDLFGLSTTYGYYSAFIAHEKRVILHNRAAGAALMAGILYANIIV